MNIMVDNPNMVDSLILYVLKNKMPGPVHDGEGATG
jgi:hypothetical protein